MDKALRVELKQAVKAVRHASGRFGSTKLFNGWTATCRGVYNSRGAAGFSWKWNYHLISPTGKVWGGHDRADSFVLWAVRFIVKQASAKA